MFWITYNEPRGKQVVMTTEAIVVLLVDLMLASVCLAEAQQPKQLPRIGSLSAGFTIGTSRTEAFRQGLRELGYVEGENIFIEDRSGDRQRRKKGLVELAADLVRLQVDVIVALDSSSARAARKATNTIPIVMRASGDPVEEGLVTNLVRPDGNITGLYYITEELTRRRLQILKEANPRLARVGVLWNPFRARWRSFKEAEFVATSLGLQLQSLEVRVAHDLERAFQTAIREHAQAIITLRTTPLMVYERQRIVALAIKSGLPAIYDDGEFVEAGGLMSYGANMQDLYKRAAFYVDKILKGAKPGELPMEGPRKFELVVNLKAANQIGLTIPQSILYRADKVIKLNEEAQWQNQIKTRHDARTSRLKPCTDRRTGETLD